MNIGFFMIMAVMYLFDIEATAQFKSDTINHIRLLYNIRDSFKLDEVLLKELKLHRYIYNFNYMNNEDEQKIDFILVPFYKISKSGVHYNYNKDITDVIEIDTTSFWVFFRNKNGFKGYFTFLFRNKKWIYLSEFFMDGSPMKIGIETIMQEKPERLFTIKYLDGIWMLKGNSVSVYSFFNKKLLSEIDYLKKATNLQEIHDFARGKEGGTPP
jgi:hypothetical protein